MIPISIDSLKTDWKNIVYQAIECEDESVHKLFSEYGKIYKSYLLKLLHEQKEEDALEAVYLFINTGIVIEKENNNGKLYLYFNNNWRAE